VSVVNSSFDVQLAAAASCRVARLRTSGAIALLPWGRITAPTTSSVQGTGVSTGAFGGDMRPGTQQHSLTLVPASLINPTNSINEDKYDVVVDDNPGVRSWSPPV